jgi:hypothetical protein
MNKNCIECGPNPVTDNNSDNSIERHNRYLYKFTNDVPYWKAFSTFLKAKLLKHDNYESMLGKMRDLDFKLRDAWTPDAKPFTEHH